MNNDYNLGDEDFNLDPFNENDLPAQKKESPSKYTEDMTF